MRRIRDQLPRGQRERVAGAHVDWRHEVAVVREPGDQGAQVPGETDRHGGDRAGLDHHHRGPPEQEPDQGREGFPKVHVLPAGPRHHRGQLAVRKGRDDRERGADGPREEQPPDAPQLPRHLGRDEEHAGPDHRPDHDHRGVEQPQAAGQFSLGVGRGARADRAPWTFRRRRRVQRVSPCSTKNLPTSPREKYLEVIVFLRVKNSTASRPWACRSPKNESFQPENGK